MGEVYLARDTKLEREVALKVLPAELADDPERRARFEREARAAAAVTHRNIATIFEVGEAEGRVFLAMEYVEGESLRQRLERPLDVAEALRIASEIARGLAKAHAADVVHRDLKPDNVMLDEDGHARILDFGLAKLREGDEVEESTTSEDDVTETAALTREGQVLGTPGYMSPEQAAGKAVDHRTDIFSLGTILYEMLTGQRAFDGDSLMETVASTLRDEPEPVSVVNSEVDPSVDELVARCLAKDRAKRFQSAGELADALATQSSATSSAASLEHADTVIASKMSTERPPAKAKPWWFWPVIAVGMAAAFSSIDRVKTCARGRPATVSTAGSNPSDEATASPAATASNGQNPGWMAAPKTESAEALEAYREGLRASRDGVEAPAHFEKAVQLDPGLASAHLRIATWYAYAPDITLARKALALARKHADRLREPERLWLEALEPQIARHPADYDESAQRFSKAIERFPDDPELLAHGATAIERSDPKRALALYGRAAEIDPGYTLAIFAKAETELYSGDIASAEKTLAACMKRRSMLCRMSAMRLAQQRGDCAAFERYARDIIASYPKHPLGYLSLAQALASQGKPPAAVAETLSRSHGKLAGSGDWLEKHAATYQAQMNATGGALWGDFQRAEKGAQQWVKVVADAVSQESHGGPAAMLALIYEETGRRDLAARAAETFLNKRSAWEPNSRVEDYAITSDVVPHLLRVLRRAGRLSHDELAQRLDRWVAEWTDRGVAPRFRSYLWAAGYASAAATEEDGKLALDQLAEFEPLPAYRPDGLLEYDIGRTYLLAGKAEEAIEWLTRATKVCRALDEPMGHNRSFYWLGRAYEAAGDERRACQAYGGLLGRWGRAKPKSVTADDARKRFGALGCKMPDRN
jgi:serine/threonine-protein kinase